jgi:hypothetical protein
MCHDPQTLARRSMSVDSWRRLVLTRGHLLVLVCVLDLVCLVRDGTSRPVAQERNAYIC